MSKLPYPAPSGRRHDSAGLWRPAPRRQPRAPRRQPGAIRAGVPAASTASTARAARAGRCRQLPPLGLEHQRLPGFHRRRGAAGPTRRAPAAPRVLVLLLLHHLHPGGRRRHRRPAWPAPARRHHPGRKATAAAAAAAAGLGREGCTLRCGRHNIAATAELRATAAAAEVSAGGLLESQGLTVRALDWVVRHHLIGLPPICIEMVDQSRKSQVSTPRPRFLRPARPGRKEHSAAKQPSTHRKSGSGERGERGRREGGERGV